MEWKGKESRIDNLYQISGFLLSVKCLILKLPALVGGKCHYVHFAEVANKG